MSLLFSSSGMVQGCRCGSRVGDPDAATSGSANYRGRDSHSGRLTTSSVGPS